MLLADNFGKMSMCVYGNNTPLKTLSEERMQDKVNIEFAVYVGI